MRTKSRRTTYRLRRTVERLPLHTKEAMLRGIATNRIIVGAYVDPGSGGICPMLAAHRNGGRTEVASFARAWDEFTGARSPRRATWREVRTLRAMLEWSLDAPGNSNFSSLAEAAAQIRAEREQFRCAQKELAQSTPAPAEAPQPETELPDVDPAEIRVRRRRDTGERHRVRELWFQRDWAWMRPTRRLDEYKDLLAAAEEQLSEQSARELLGAELSAQDPASH